MIPCKMGNSPSNKDYVIWMMFKENFFIYMQNLRISLIDEFYCYQVFLFLSFKICVNIFEESLVICTMLMKLFSRSSYSSNSLGPARITKTRRVGVQANSASVQSILYYYQVCTQVKTYFLRRFIEQANIIQKKRSNVISC